LAKNISNLFQSLKHRFMMKGMG